MTTYRIIFRPCILKAKSKDEAEKVIKQFVPQELIDDTGEVCPYIESIEKL